MLDLRLLRLDLAARRRDGRNLELGACGQLGERLALREAVVGLAGRGGGALRILAAEVRVVVGVRGGLGNGRGLLLGFLLAHLAIPERTELARRLLLERRRAALVLAGGERRRRAARVFALLVAGRRLAVLIAARENAFPGDAVVHEKLVRARLARVASDWPSRDREQARDASRRDATSTSLVSLY